MLLAAVEIVAEGQPRVRIEVDESAQARAAAELLRRHVVLMTGAALPSTGTAPPLRLRHDATPGYTIRPLDGGGALVSGSDLVRAAYDLLEGWGCSFLAGEPTVPRHTALALEARRHRPARELYVDRFDPSLPLTGVAIDGLAGYDAARFREALALGYPLRVASTSFDDFCPPALFEEQPEWFALRRGKRTPRGNFALTNEAARAHYLDRLGDWLEAHPEVAVVGLWPEVTSVWCEASEAIGHAEAYALLWREAAARFPGRRFEILATGLTLRPPPGNLPKNVEVRLRPGREASALQGVAAQPIDAVVRAWEVRGARLLLEIDAAPESWCGLPWPCHDAVRADARRFGAAVLRHADPHLARLWRDPDARLALPPAIVPLLPAAARLRSWGHPRDAAELFPAGAQPLADIERLWRSAMDESAEPESRRSAATEAYFGYRALLAELPAAAADSYRRYRGRDQRRMLEELLPHGAERTLGPATVRDTFDRVEVETTRLRLAIDRATATIVSVRRKLAADWSEELAGDDGRYFSVVALGAAAGRRDGEVRLLAPEPTLLRIELSGAQGNGGARWTSRLDLRGGTARVAQTATVSVPGGIAVGCRWAAGVYDRWVCPPYAAEGRFGGEGLPSLRMVPGTLLFCRRGETGPGLAARLPRGGTALLTHDGQGQLVATSRGTKLLCDWILFTHTGELGHSGR